MKSCRFIFPLLLAFCCACTPSQEKSRSTIFNSKKKHSQASELDLDDLQKNGELIAVTLSGPDTYYEIQGQGFGLQYELIADFAQLQGLRIRMEIAHDTTEMLKMLNQGEADVVALPIPKNASEILCAIQDTVDSQPHGWLTRENSPTLAEAIDNWYKPGIITEVRERQRQRSRKASRYYPTEQHKRPKVLNASRGIISEYDELFRRNASVCGWDWRLLAAQCYQESAFNPSSISFAGAQGLMQLMPSTARSLGVQDNVFDPSTNVGAAARYIKELNNSLSDITNSDERINFVLASYNGGIGHVRDAMNLTKKYGGNPYVWAEVGEYILKLSDATYYRDPIVKYGYLRGKETHGYVSKIRSHWEFYKTVAN